MTLTKNQKMGIGIGGLAAAIGVAMLAGRGGAEPQPGMATLIGKTYDVNTTLPIQGLQVYLNGWLKSTNSQGRFQFANVSPDMYDITIIDPQNRYETYYG